MVPLLIITAVPDTCRGRCYNPHLPTLIAAMRLLNVVYIDTTGPYLALLGGSRLVVMSMDSTSRLQSSHMTHDIKASVILAAIKCFVADMGIPRSFRRHNKTAHLRSQFVRGLLNQYPNST